MIVKLEVKSTHPPRHGYLRGIQDYILIRTRGIPCTFPFWQRTLYRFLPLRLQSAGRQSCYLQSENTLTMVFTAHVTNMPRANVVLVALALHGNIDVAILIAQLLPTKCSKAANSYESHLVVATMSVLCFTTTEYTHTRCLQRGCVWSVVVKYIVHDAAQRVHAQTLPSASYLVPTVPNSSVDPLQGPPPTSHIF